MSLKIFINAIGLNNYARMFIDRDKTAFEIVHDRLSTLGSDIYIMSDHHISKSIVNANSELVVHSTWTLPKFVEAIATRCGDTDVIVHIRGDAPMVNIEHARSLLDIHKKYIAEYTYADGYPDGMTVEILQGIAVQGLKNLIKEDETVSADTTLFSIIERDINAFDIEVDIAPVDCRHLRSQFFCNTKNNFLLMKKIIKYTDMPLTEILRTINSAPLMLRQLPAFASIEVVSRHVQNIEYSPYTMLNQNRNIPIDEMPLSSYQSLINKIHSFSPEIMLHISLWGEVALHSDILKIISTSLEVGIQTVVETSGVGWKKNILERILSADYSQVKWIVALDSNNSDHYRAIRGDGYDEAHSFGHALLEAHPENTFIQAVRLKEYESELENFYKYWSEITNNVIIVKYDHFCGRLDDRKVVDISPIHRYPCWHIKRDLNILIDGSVPLCREDILSEHILGNVFQQELAEIWNAGVEYYKLHIDKKYPALCSLCDEYYTFNN